MQPRNHIKGAKILPVYFPKQSDDRFITCPEVKSPPHTRHIPHILTGIPTEMSLMKLTQLKASQAAQHRFLTSLLFHFLFSCLLAFCLSSPKHTSTLCQKYFQGKEKNWPGGSYLIEDELDREETSASPVYSAAGVQG